MEQVETLVTMGFTDRLANVQGMLLDIRADGCRMSIAIICLSDSVCPHDNNQSSRN